ncbi:MAG: amino acid ABC transporter ATP-binding protein [Firmicutes bacterium]|nr:amino acid ABC transporter ATP-binding protein [Candidatus Caballimonas caccae]
MAFLEISNFNKKYGKTEALKDINLSIEKGEIVSIIGPSGSGKSTLLRCINFRESVDSGKMALDGNVLIDGPLNKKDKTLTNKCLKFGYVYSPLNLIPEFSVFKNISLVPTALLREKYKKIKKVTKLNKEEEVDTGEEKNLDEKVNINRNDLMFPNKNENKANKKEWFDKERDEIRIECSNNLKKVGLEDKNWAFPNELSFGQQQRVAIAKELSSNPMVLCCDDLTTVEVYNTLKSLKDKKMPIIVATHELDFAKNVSDKVVFMMDGAIEAVGTPKEIFETPKSKKLKAFLSSVKYKG